MGSGGATQTVETGRPAGRALAWTVLLGAQLAVGSAALLARLGLDAGLSAAAMSAWRLGIASALLCLFALLRRRRGPTPTIAAAARARLVGAGVLLALHFVTWFASLQHVSVARSVLLIATTPVWTGLLGPLFGRGRTPAVFWLGLLVAAAGTWLFVGTDAGRAAPVGDLLAVIGAVAIALYLLLVQDDQAVLGTQRVVQWTYTSAAVTIALYCAAVLPVDTLAPGSGAAWVAVVGMALGPQLLGHTGINASLRRFSAAAVAASTLLEPVFAAALAWWLLREPLTLGQMAGGLLLLGGVALSLQRGERNA